MTQELSARFKLQCSQPIIVCSFDSDTSHTRTDMSSEPDTIRVPSLENATELTPPFIENTRYPSLENATEVTQLIWSFSSISSTPVDTSHTRTELSSEQDTIRVPSLENATELTQSVWLTIISSTPVDTSNTSTELSSE